MTLTEQIAAAKRVLNRCEELDENRTHPEGDPATDQEITDEFKQLGDLPLFDAAFMD